MLEWKKIIFKRLEQTGDDKLSQTMDKNNMNLMNHASQIMVAKMESISVPVCMKCKNGIDGVPNCKISECDLPIELVNKDGRIGVVISNLKDGKWDFVIEDKTFDMYYIFGFDEDWDNVLHLWKMPRKAVLEHLGELTFY